MLTPNEINLFLDGRLHDESSCICNWTSIYRDWLLSDCEYLSFFYYIIIIFLMSYFINNVEQLNRTIPKLFRGARKFSIRN